MTRLLLALFLFLPATAEAAQARSRALIRHYQATHVCPATGRPGRCSGYQVDHRQPLCFYGPDKLWNLQYLTIAEHRAKTRLDMKVCRWDSLPESR